MLQPMGCTSAGRFKRSGLHGSYEMEPWNQMWSLVPWLQKCFNLEIQPRKQIGMIQRFHVQLGFGIILMRTIFHAVSPFSISGVCMRRGVTLQVVITNYGHPTHIIVVFLWPFFV